MINAVTLSNTATLYCDLKVKFSCTTLSKKFKINILRAFWLLPVHPTAIIINGGIRSLVNLHFRDSTRALDSSTSACKDCDSVVTMDLGEL